MLVICNGMPRSASTWSYNVVLRLLRDAGTGEVYGGYDDDLHHFMVSMPRSASHAVVKAHSLDASAIGLGQLAAAKVIYTWRDVADATYSFMTMFEVDFERAISAISSSLDLLAQHRGNGALIIGYDDIINDGLGSVGKIADHIGVAASQAQLTAIADVTSLNKMREQVEKISSPDYRQNLVRYEGKPPANRLRYYLTGQLHRFLGHKRELKPLIFDSETLLHVGHIRHGGRGHSAAPLTAAQQRRIADLIREKGLFQLAGNGGP
jgi:hypothetical protein